MEINIKSNKFDNDDIIKTQSYKIIQDSSIQRNTNSKKGNINYNISNYNNYSTHNFDNDEDKNINLNININNYLSKKNININSNAPINYLPKNPQKITRYNTDLTHGYLIRHMNKISQNNKNPNIKYSNNNIKETKEELKSKLLSRVNKQKFLINNNFDSKKIKITTKKGLTEANVNNQKMKEKEQAKHVPKILTFLQTFKNMALPLKLDKNKKKEIKNKKDEKNIINENKSSYNFNYRPIMKKLDINKRNEENNENINDDECIDYNRFTFRNSGDEKSPNRKNKREKKNRLRNKNEEKPLYNEDSSDSDINKNINIDAYKRKYNNNKIIHKNERYRNKYNYNIHQKINNNSEEFSPDFNHNKNTKINLIPKNINNQPYSRKSNFKEQYSSPKPVPKNQIKNRHFKINNNNNISERNERTYQNEYLDSGNESEYSFRSLNPGKIYRKQILNNSFQINENNNNSHFKNNSIYYKNNICAEQINLEPNFYTINRPNKKKKINEILININDSEDYSYNTEKNYYRPNNHMRNNRSPINRKENTTHNILLNRSPFSSKQINNTNNMPYDYSDNYESQPEEEYNSNINNNIKKKKPTTNYSRFMQTFEQRDKRLYPNEDSYLSYDIENTNKKHLYKKPLKNISNHINKNNSMYIKRVVHYENKKDSFFNESNDSFSHKRTKNDFSDYDEINNNVYDFDAPKSINDFLDDKFSSNSSIYMNESSRDNKFSINSEFPTDRSKKDELNLNNNNKNNLSFKNEEKPKIYTKKLNTMYNFYQGTKKFFSKINNKVMNLIKKEDKNSNNENIKKDNIINNKNFFTPRDNTENNDKNENLYNNNNFVTPTGFENKPKIIKNQKRIKEKVNVKKNSFCKKFYNHYMKAIHIEQTEFYFSCQKINKIKPRKKAINIPNSLSKYSIKRKIIIPTNKIPLIDKCCFERIFIDKKEKNKLKEKEKSKNIFLTRDNQINIILSKKNEQNENTNEIDNKKTYSSYNKNTFENQSIKPDNIWNVSFINNNIKLNQDNKKYQYEYDFILSLKNSQLSLNTDLLPENLLSHFKEMKENKEIIEEKNDKKENELRKKFDKGEMQQIINRYSKPNKIQQINNKDKIDKEWKRIDFTKETEQAEKYIKELNKKMEENNEQNNIIGMLNILTMDNLDDVLKKLMNLITRNEDNFILSDEEIIKNEYILIKAILNKAILEKRFVNLYAKLSNELFHKLNNVSYNSENFKTIIIDECKNKFNELSNNENISKNKIVSLDDEKIILIKKSFIGNIDFISELINTNLFSEDIGFYYLEELNNIYNKKNYSKQNDKFKINLALEATINFLSKFGKKIFSNNNILSVNKLNNFINSNLKSILDNKDLSGFLKYKIINLIEKQKNKWQDSLYEKSILAKGKLNKIKNSSNKKKIRKRRHSNKSLKIMNQNNTIKNKNSAENYSGNASLNSSTLNYIPHINLKLNTSNSTSYMDEEIMKIIEEDIIKYKTFLNENNINNKFDLNKNSQIGNGYDWSSVEEILSTNKINLIEIIRCYIEVCIDEINNSSKIYYANDYIKNIIYYYSTQLTNKERDIIRNKISILFLNIRDICVDNYNMKEIMGYLMFILIENKLYFIKDLNNFIGKEQEIIITITEVVKFAIISSEEKCKKYHNDFKQTKLFVDNSIFTENVTNMIGDYLK